jgi:hypothetical protein
MNEKQSLRKRIGLELTDLERTKERAGKAWKKYKESNDEFYLDSVVLNLHTFYAIIENVFKAIAEKLDGRMPEGPDWHAELLLQMATERPDLRPAVITAATKTSLDDYRAFRHIARNVYAFNLNSVKVEPLVRGLDIACVEFGKEMRGFIDLFAGE